MKLISASLIVKNEINNLPKLVDDLSMISDEIIIVDTGSTDGTKEWLDSCTNPKLITSHFDWVDDFSKARNYSLNMTNYKWVFWCDADDRLSPELISSINEFKRSTDIPDSIIINYDFGKGLMVPRHRIVNKASNPKWVGRVHEILTFSGRNTYDWSDYQKYGAIIHNRTHEINDRNLRILENQFKEEGTLSTRDMLYYGNELYYNERYSEAYERWISCIKDCTNFDQFNIIEKCMIMFEDNNLSYNKFKKIINSVTYLWRSDLFYFLARVQELSGEIENAVVNAKTAIRVANSETLNVYSRYGFNPRYSNELSKELIKRYE